VQASSCRYRQCNRYSGIDERVRFKQVIRISVSIPIKKGALTVIHNLPAAKCPEISPQRSKTVHLEKIEDGAKPSHPPSPKRLLSLQLAGESRPEAAAPSSGHKLLSLTFDDDDGHDVDTSFLDYIGDQGPGRFLEGWILQNAYDNTVFSSA
jgi:hypothetical protein